MYLLKQTGWSILAVALGMLAIGHRGIAAETNPPGQDDRDAWGPKLYALCLEMPFNKQPSVARQAELLRELGFDGVAYSLWLDESLGKNLKTLDEAGLPVCMMYTSVNVNPQSRPYDPRLPEAIRTLKGRPVTICVSLRGLPPGDPAGMEPAVKIVRQLGDLAAECGLRISIYFHVRNWTESFPFTLQVVEETNHPAVGANFNLCHWLKVEGDKDYQPVLRRGGEKIFAVTINGAQLGSDTWTDGLIQPLDRGDFDNRRLLATLRQIGYRGPIGLMCYGVPGEPREYLQRSINVWRAWQAESDQQ